MKPIQKGFSLVEIMVGLAIGMIAMIVVMQVFSMSEGQKRTTTGGADAQTNGAMALYMIERDTRMAGWGLDSSTTSSCNSSFSYCDGSAACGGAAGPLAGINFASIRITDGGEDPDTITAQYFADPNLDTFRYPATTTLRSSMPQSSAELNVASVSGCVDGGMALVSQGGSCTLMQITHVQGPALKIQHNPGGSGIYNPTINYQKANGWPAYTKGAVVSCFRPAATAPFYEKEYSVDTATRQLQHTDNTITPPAVNQALVPEIIDLQAQYGIAPAGSQVVDAWVDAKGGPWANPTVDDRKRIKAVRIALVARSTQYEKLKANGACVTTTEEMVEKWSTWAKFDTENYPANWQCYRYKVFETVVPLRNVMWGNL